MTDKAPSPSIPLSRLPDDDKVAIIQWLAGRFVDSLPTNISSIIPADALLEQVSEETGYQIPDVWFGLQYAAYVGALSLRGEMVYKHAATERSRMGF